MRKKLRTVLIVEDNLDYHKLFKRAVDLASERLKSQLREIQQDLSKDGLLTVDEPTGIDQALFVTSEAEAKELLEQEQWIDFISMDLALADDENQRADTDGGISGLRLLHMLSTWKRRPLAAIVSGEQAQSYSLEATLALKVFSFVPKNHFDIPNYSRLITAACLYQEANDIINAVEALESDPDNLEVARRCWRSAQDIVRAHQGDRALFVNFPESLDRRIQAHVARLDRITLRPTGDAIEQVLRERVIGRRGWTIIRVQLTNYASFRATYTSAIEPLHYIIAQAIKGALTRYKPQVFFGVISPEYTPEPYFIIMLWGGVENSHVREIEGQIVSAYRDQNIGLLPLIAIYRDQNIALSRDNDSLQHLLPQPKFTLWNAGKAEFDDLFPDIVQAIDTLTH